MVFLILILILVLLLIPCIVFGVIGYVESVRNFKLRFEGYGDFLPAMQERFPDWSAEPVSFSNNLGNRLNGYLFRYPQQEQKALVVLFHGYSMSLEDYLPECEFFCRRGYAVLAFDGCGNDHSEGVMYGLPQHIPDLQSCLEYVTGNDALNQLPLLLYGHSWGGYAVDSVSAVEQFPLRGIISASAFATSTAALHDHAVRRYGVLGKLSLTGIRLLLIQRFGKLASVTAIKGLAQTTCPVLVTQSDDDRIIQFSKNYGKLYQKFSSDPRFTFLPLTGHNHNITTPHEADRAKLKIMTKINRGDRTREAMDELMPLRFICDEELLGKFADFYDSCLN